ncbi:hypothetical protein ALI22I_05720 [Saccharothrix sp. ALI-22-I]|uniref:hypothetical protein n=1 Tax=Saccharothrix sp. ALI-22-I TaxID=1933778 RepID=UPI00097C40D7|nr:hypothetical protein [Saccharothrix sp. ALI-22-I]ONI92111.1 hypothetical protein ALI22I_05720 [Saccharothrix sp. ALI-22-I]
MGAVSGKIPYQDSDDEESELLPFGQWLFKTIVRQAGDEEWSVIRDKTSTRHLYLWLESEEAPGKGADHFRDKEHLHLIDNGGDVDISTKHPKALNILPDGKYEKRTAADKEPQHFTGTKALNKGTSLPITVCTRNEPPDEVVDWQRKLITDLRATTLDWLRAVASNAQIAEFLA